MDWDPPAGRYHHGALAVRTLGEDGEPTVLVHGLCGSNLYWGAAYDRLATRGLVAVPDLLGFGSSPRLADTAYGPDDHAEALGAALGEVGIAGPALVVAHSTGCLVALRLAVRHPRLVSGIVGFGPPLYPTPARRAVAWPTSGCCRGFSPPTAQWLGVCASGPVETIPRRPPAWGSFCDPICRWPSPATGSATRGRPTQALYVE